VLKVNGAACDESTSVNKPTDTARVLIPVPPRPEDCPSLLGFVLQVKKWRLRYTELHAPILQRFSDGEILPYGYIRQPLLFAARPLHVDRSYFGIAAQSERQT
jgi:hypothetical protein